MINNFQCFRRFLVLSIFLLIIGFVLLYIPQFWCYFFPLPCFELISTYAERYGLDPYLVAAIIKVESNFNPQAVSPVGARGLMQVMPDTGREVAGQLNLDDFYPERLFDPDYNLNIGCWYLADLMHKYNGNKIVVLAAYNGGRGNVQKWLAGGWDGTIESVDQIPYKETRLYIKKVMFRYELYSKLYTKERFFYAKKRNYM